MLRPRHPIVAIIDIVFAVIIFFTLFTDLRWFEFAYLVSVLTMFAFSSFFHWVPHTEVNRRIDHALIYLLIACTVLPYWEYLHEAGKEGILFMLFITAVIGSLNKLFNGISSRVVSSVMFSIVGLLSVFTMAGVPERVGTHVASLFWIGVALYALQQLIYTKKMLDIAPDLFGYREIQHFVLVCAASLHTAVVVTML